MTVLKLYDALLELRDDPIVRLNRAVAVAEVVGPQAGLDDVEGLDGALMTTFAPYHAVRADLLRRLQRSEEARAAYETVLSLGPPPAERIWLERQRELASRLRPSPPALLPPAIKNLAAVDFANSARL